MEYRFQKACGRGRGNFVLVSEGCMCVHMHASIYLCIQLCAIDVCNLPTPELIALRSIVTLRCSGVDECAPDEFCRISKKAIARRQQTLKRLSSSRISPLCAAGAKRLFSCCRCFHFIALTVTCDNCSVSQAPKTARTPPFNPAE